MIAPDIHLEALTPTQRRILQACARTTSSWGTYLAGGAAAALQLGHRRSDDFDWFGPRAVPPDDLLKDVRTLGSAIEVDQNREGTFLGRVDGVKFSVSATAILSSSSRFSWRARRSHLRATSPR